MIKTIITYFVFPVFVAFGLLLLFSHAEKNDVVTLREQVEAKYAPAPASATEKEMLEKVLSVPYVSEAPEGIWTQPWVNACEEASIMMIDEFYKGRISIGVVDAKNYFQDLFVKEKALFGSSINTDSAEIAETINKYTSFSGNIKRNPTLEEIKNEIAEGRPVLSLHRGFDLKNANIGFAPALSSYHTLVIIGYDDERDVFITHDPGDEVAGENHEYDYDIFMNSLHDYDHARDKADLTPTVIFTSRK